jgi:putative hemolysin
MSEQPAQLIDVEKVFESKNKNLYKRIPGFVIRYLKRIVHQDELNEFIKRNSDKPPFEFIDAGLEMFNVSIQANGIEKIAGNKRVIFAANHPLGGIDGVSLVKVIGEEIDRGVKITANDILMNISQLRPVFLGVNKHGTNVKSYIAQMHESFKSESPIIFFPAGLISRRSGGRIEDLEWKRTFIKKAVEYKRDIVPVYVSGRVSGFFYRLANIRKFLGIKQNIEMLYLPNEMFKQKNIKLDITFGNPLSWETFTTDKTPEEWAQKVKATVYSLGKKM